MKKRLHEILNTQISRRETVTTAAKIGSAVALSNAISLPFSSSALAAPEAATVNSGETVRHSACLVNCGSRCALKVIVKDDRIVRIEPEDAIDDAVFGQHQIRPCLRGRSNRWRVYSPDRIKYPMKRVGKRGEGKFKRISWGVYCGGTSTRHRKIWSRSHLLQLSVRGLLSHPGNARLETPVKSHRRLSQLP